LFGSGLRLTEGERNRRWRQAGLGHWWPESQSGGVQLAPWGDGALNRSDQLFGSEDSKNDVA